MSTVPLSNSTFTARLDAVGAPPDENPAVASQVRFDATHDSRSADATDDHLVRETRREVRAIVREIEELCQSDGSSDRFLDEFLKRVVLALASHGGAVWMTGDEASFELVSRINLEPTGLLDSSERQSRHARLLQSTLQSQRAALVPPRWAAGEEDESGNPTEFLLLIAAIRVDAEKTALVEIFQRPGGGPSTQRGFLQFLSQMCRLADDHFRRRRLIYLERKQTQWHRFETFLREIHRDLDLLPTAYAIANDGREVIGADRVSVAIRHGNRCPVRVVSGLDSIDRRAVEVRKLGHLAALVTAIDEPLWYDGTVTDLPPRVEQALNDYVDRAHCRVIGVLPLRDPSPKGDETPGSRRPIGALIVERTEKPTRLDDLLGRSHLVAEHSSAALSGALRHDQVFLLPLWRVLGRLASCLGGRRLPRTLAVTAVVAAVVCAGLLVEHDFHVPARGKLRPSIQRDVFAAIDGTVVEVPVRHSQAVRRGELLARLENSQLDYEITTLGGQLTTTREQLSAQTRALAESHHAGSAEQSRIGGVLQELRQSEANLVRQLELLHGRRELLDVRCAFPGQVVTWRVVDRLMNRPVRRGQVLMTVIDPDSEWELELNGPERYMGHVLDARENSSDELPVTFQLSSHPGLTFGGRVTEIQRTAHARDEQGNTVLIRVAIDKDELPELRSETTVTAKIDCGRRPIGFVWFHDLIETIQSKVLFWI